MTTAEFILGITNRAAQLVDRIGERRGQVLEKYANEIAQVIRSNTIDDAVKLLQLSEYLARLEKKECDAGSGNGFLALTLIVEWFINQVLLPGPHYVTHEPDVH